MYPDDNPTNIKEKSRTYYSIIITLMLLGLLIIILIPFFVFLNLSEIMEWTSSRAERTIYKIGVATLEDPDKDNDGISNIDETNIYGTDPENSDSNNNGIPDGEEIYNIFKKNVSNKDSKELVLYRKNITEKGITSLEKVFAWYGTQTYNFYIGIPDELKDKIRESLALRRDKKFQESINVLESALKNNPEAWVLKYHIGLSYHGMENFGKALEYYEGLLDNKDALNPLLYQDIASSYLGLKDEKKYVEYLQKSIEEFPEYLEAYSRLAQQYIDKNNLPAAKKIVNNGLKIEPRYSVFYNLLGIISGIEGNKDKELEYYKKITKIDLHNAITHMNLSISYREDFNNPKEALVEALIANEFNSDYSHIKSALGLAYDANGDFDKAIIEYEKGIAMDPTYDKLYNNLGNTYFNKGQYALAEKNYKKAIELNPDYAKVYGNLSSLQLAKWIKGGYKDDGEALKAIPYAERSIEINSDWYLPYEILGRMYGKMTKKGTLNSYAKAEINLKKSIELNYNNQLSHEELGYVYYWQRKNNEAIKAWESAISLGLKNEEVSRLLKNIRR